MVGRGGWGLEKGLRVSRAWLQGGVFSLQRPVCAEPRGPKTVFCHGRCVYGHSLEEGSPSKFSVSSWLWVGYST